MRFSWDSPDPVERVFGIVIVGAIIVGITLFFLGPSEILGMTRDNLIMFFFLGGFGTALGLFAVRWFRKREEVGGGRRKGFSDLIDRLKNDRVELVFGIFSIVGVLIFVALLLYDSDTIFGMNRLFLMVLTILGIIGVRVAWSVVRVVRQFM